MSDSIDERAKRLGVPVVPKLPMQKPYDPNPVVAICGECGRDIHMMEGYCCGRNNCPVQPRVIA
jgi:hypothetical protein